MIAGIIFCSISGVLLHFAFDWTNQNAFVGLFSAVNESIWEHLKLLFYPVVLFSFIEYFIYKKKLDAFIASRSIGLLLCMFFIVSAYYTYSGIIGDHYAFIDISLYFIAVIIVFVFSYIAIKNNFTAKKHAVKICVCLIILFSILFSVWTFYPPHINLFKDVPSGTYGIFRGL